MGIFEDYARRYASRTQGDIRSGQWDPYSPEAGRGGRLYRGYLGHTTGDMQAYLDFLSGKGDLSKLGDPNLLTTQYGAEPRFISRAMYYGFKNDPRIQKYQKQLDELQSGSMEKKLRGVSREAIGGANAAQRSGVNDAMATAMGGGMAAPGVQNYLNRKMDVALTGQLGDAYRQAALQDINTRMAAGGELMNMAQYETGLLQNIGQVAADQTKWNQPTLRESPWKSMGMNLLGSAVGAGVGYFTGGLGMGLAGSLFGGGQGQGQGNPGAGTANRIPLSGYGR